MFGLLCVLLGSLRPGASIVGCVRVSSLNERRLVSVLYEGSGEAPRMWNASRAMIEVRVREGGHQP